MEEREPLLRDDDEQNNRIVNGKFTLLEKSLFGVSVALLISVCALAGLYARHTIEDNRPSPVEPIPTHNSSAPVCLTPECVLTAAEILKDIDLTVDPCDNFYEYTCSNWEKSHEIPDGKSSINAFVSLIQQNKQVLHGILSRDFDDIHTSVLPDPKKLVDKQNFEKVKALYDSCMNQDAIDKRGASPIHDMVRQVKKITKQSRSFTQGLSYFAQRDIGVLFEIMVDADPKDPTQNSLQLYQSGLTLPSKVYYTQNATVNALEEAVADTLKAVFDDTGSEFNWIKDSARLVVDFEKELAAISQLPEELQDPETIYNPYSLSELAALVPGIDWGLYVDHLLPDSAPHPGKIVVTSPTYIGNVSKLLEETSEHTLQAYFTWQAIYNYANALNDEVRKPIRKLTATLIGTDPKVVKPRWDTCLDEVNGFVGFLAGRYYVLDKFGGDAKERADDFVNSIKQVFVQRLPDLTWLDDKTRERAVQKVDQLIRKVGYPDKTPDIMSPVSLSDYYTDLELKGSDFFGNYMRGREWAISQQWKQVGQTPDRSKWFMNPQEVNAYYNPSFNEIVFPAGILQNPFFSNQYPDYLNYGGIGVVVGHELTHGFDNMGRHFDAQGRLVEWWTEETSKAFDNKSQCFIKQYSNFTMDVDNGESIHVNGKLTLGENLADNGGLGESFIAWKKRYDSDRESKRYNNVLLPGLEHLTPEQLFFVNFGRIWCHKATKAQAKKSVLTDEHSPPLWRVNGAIQNSKHFAEVYNCPAGSKMNPIKKCELW